jgi:hypothetical protein
MFSPAVKPGDKTGFWSTSRVPIFLVRGSKNIPVWLSEFRVQLPRTKFLLNTFDWKRDLAPDPWPVLNDELSKSQCAWGVSLCEAKQIQEALQKGAHFLHIPGDICRQADVLDAARSSGLPLILERGAFLPPPDFERAILKLNSADVLALDAGSTFGYGIRIFDALATHHLGGAPLGLCLDSLATPPAEMPSWTPKWFFKNSTENLLTFKNRECIGCARSGVFTTKLF